MSTSYDRGRDFEKWIAHEMRRRGFKAFRDPRSGAGDTYKTDIAAPGFNFGIEAKSQSTIKLRDWWRQALSGSPTYKMPALAIETDDGDKLAILRFSDFLDLVAQVAEDTERIKVLMSQNNKT